MRKQTVQGDVVSIGNAKVARRRSARGRAALAAAVRSRAVAHGALLALSVGAATVAGRRASAANYYWNAQTGTWETSGNWQNGSGGALAGFPKSRADTADVSNGGLVLLGGSPTYNASSLTTGMNVAGGSGAYQLSGSSTLNLGTNASNSGLILGYSVGSTGTFNMLGGTLAVNNNSSAAPANPVFLVGDAGTATFNLAGGTVNLTFFTPQNLGLGNTSTGTGVLNVTGGTFNTGTTAANATGLYVGQNGIGVLNVSGGVVNVYNRLNVGNASSGSGVVYLSGTGVINQGFGNGTPMIVGGSNSAGTGTGSFVQTGGTFNGSNAVQIGNATAGATGASGIVYQTAGAFNVSANSFVGNTNFGGQFLTGGTYYDNGAFTSVGRNSGGFGVVDVSGTATYTVNNSRLIVGEVGTGILSVRAGGSVTINNTSTTTASGFNNSNPGLTLVNASDGVAGSTGIVNLLGGGVITAPNVGSSSTAGTSIFNFNGGTLQTTANSSSPGVSFVGGMTKAYVYGGGAIINTGAGSGTITQPLSTVTGTTGLSTIPVTAAGAGYIAPPIVQITSSGGGVGASAVATVNAAGQVTGITITNPGTGYDTGTTAVNLIGGRLNGATGTAATLGAVSTAANVGGALVKNGANTLTLAPTAANTYDGGTIVNAGTLVAGNSFALPANTPLTNNGATVAFNGAYPQPQGSATPGLTLSSLTSPGGSTFGFNASSAGVDSVNFTGTSAVTGTNTVALSVPAGTTLATGTYDLLTDAAGGLGNNTFTLGSVTNVITGGMLYPVSLSSTDTADILTIGAGQIAKLYYTGQSGTDLGTAGNYSTDPGGTVPATIVPTANTDVVFTATAGVNNLAPTVSSAIAANSLEFNNASGVTVGGSGTITLSAGANTFVAGTGIVVDAGAGPATISANLGLAASQSFINNSTANPLTLTGAIGGSGVTLTYTGAAGTAGFTVSGPSTYTGGTVIAMPAGTAVTVGNGTPLGNANNVVALNSGSLNVAGGANAAVGSLNLSGGTLAGAGTLTLTSTGAAVLIPVGTTYAAATAAATGNLALTGATNFVAKASGTGNVVLGGSLALSGATTVSLADTSGDNAPEMAITGLVSGPGSLTLNDAATVPGVTPANRSDFATLVLTNPSNSYSGGTNINYGRVVVANGTALGSGTVTIGIGPGNASGGTLQLGNATYNASSSPLAVADSTAVGSGFTIANNIVLGGAISGNYSSGILNAIGNNTLAGTVTLANANQIVTVASGTSLTINGVISNVAGLAAAQLSTPNALSGTLVLNGSNAYTGGTLVGNGNTVKVGNASALGNASNYVTISAGTNSGQLDLSGFSVTQGTLNLAGGRVIDSTAGGSVTVPMGTGTLTLGAAGGIAIDINSTQATPYPTGATNVAVSVPNLVLQNGGFIAKPEAGGFPVISSAVTLPAGTTTTAVLAASGTGAPELLFLGPISGGGGLTLANNATVPGVTMPAASDAATLGLGGSNSYSGGTNISYGRVVINNSNALGTGPVTIGGGVGVTGGTLQLGASLYTNTSSPLFNTTTVTGLNLANAINLGGATAGQYKAGIVNLTGTNAFSGPITITQAAANVQVNTGTTLTFSNVVGQATGVTGGLTVVGNTATAGGVLILTSAETYTGPTNISGSATTLQLGDGTSGHDGTIAGTAGVTDAGTLAFNRFGANSAGYVISGTGAVTVSGTGSQTLTAANTYTGATTVNAGATLQLGDGTSGHDGTITGTSGVTNNGTLAYNRFGAGNTAAYNISGSGAVTMAGAGSQALTGSNTYAGGTTISAGTLVGGSNSAVGAGPVAVATGAKLAVAAPAAGGRTVLTVNGLSIGGTGAVDVAANDLDLPGASLSTVNGLVATGFASGTWAGPGGIGSSAAAADAAHLTAVGVIQNNAGGTPLFGDGTTYPLFDRAAVGASDVLIKYTYYGDLNLDGVVNAADYTRLDAGYVMSLTGWANGDVNYDGVVDGSDYALTDNAFNQQSTALATNIVASGALVASPALQLGASSAAVPEPATVAVLAVGVVGLLGRRRRRA